MVVPGRRVCVELIVPVPGARVALQRRNDGRKRLAKTVLRLPPEQRPCARAVEDIVVVAAVDHPRLDEVVATACFVLQNRSEERRVGKAGVSTCTSQWSPYHYKKKKIKLDSIIHGDT